MAALKLKNIKTDYYFLGISFVILIPIIFYPIFNDLSIYITAGKTIFHGGRIYVDYVDLKPPLFYYFYTLIYMLTGGTEIGIRLFDYFWQILTIITIFKITKKIYKEKEYSYLSVIIYAVSYSALTFAEIMHTESFISLPVLLIIYYEITFKNNWKIYIVEGILLGLIIYKFYSDAVLAKNRN